MAAEAAKRLATYEDLLRLPEGVRAEVIGGELLMAPSALPEHGWATLQLGALLEAGLRGRGGGGGAGPGGWWILPEVDVRLSPHDIVRPDLAGWRRERLPKPWGVRPIDVPPDWVCEVLSPSTALRDRGVKMELYGRAGVRHCWLLDPAAGLLEAYRFGELPGGARRWVRLGGWGREATVRIEPFEELAVEVARLLPPEPASEEAEAGDGEAP